MGNENEQKETVLVPEEVTGTVRFGIGQIQNPSPMWARWVFRIYLYIASILTVIITTDDSISPEKAKKWAKWLAYGTMAVHGATKLFGVKIDEDEFKSQLPHR